MSGSSNLREFLDTAKRQGTTDETLLGLLRGRGWPEEDAYRVLADHYEAQSGLQVPAYKRSGSAKDAFLYLLSFSTLGTWTFGIGSVMFTLIDRWIKDPLNPTAYYRNSYYQIAGALASVIVAFPVYVLGMRYIVREIEVHPEKLESAVRKWLTYIALLIAAGVVIGDLITFLDYFLRGELTTRFVSKVAVVLVIAGGVFWYYLGSLQKSASPFQKTMRRNVWATVAATIAVLIVLILGFRFLGSPGSQRNVQSDLRVVRAMSELAQQINYKWNSSGKTLPSNMDGFPNSMKQDPVTAKTYVYKPKPDNKYELCATFATDNRDEQNTGANDASVRWIHPKGDFCFEFDASEPVPMVPYY